MRWRSGCLAFLPLVLAVSGSRAQGPDQPLAAPVLLANVELPEDRVPRAQPPEAGKPGPEEMKEPSAQPPSRPVLYPAVPFPPPAPAVVDPRTGAWQQVQGGYEELQAVLPPLEGPVREGPLSGPAQAWPCGGRCPALLGRLFSPARPPAGTGQALPVWAEGHRR